MADAEDGFTDNDWELAECVVINIGNVHKMTMQPICLIALEQAKALAARIKARQGERGS